MQLYKKIALAATVAAAFAAPSMAQQSGAATVPRASRASRTSTAFGRP